MEGLSEGRERHRGLLFVVVVFFVEVGWLGCLKVGGFCSFLACLDGREGFLVGIGSMQRARSS